MSGAETARRRVVQRRIGGAEMALPHISLRYMQGVNLVDCWQVDFYKCDVVNLHMLCAIQLSVFLIECVYFLQDIHL